MKNTQSLVNIILLRTEGNEDSTADTGTRVEGENRGLLTDSKKVQR